MSQLPRITLFLVLAGIVLFAITGCSHTAEPPSSPDQVTGEVRQTSKPEPYRAPNGLPVNVTADRFATTNEIFVAMLQTQT